jgi:archaellum component FlaF (FlaF/FlaG flagellin family)
MGFEVSGTFLLIFFGVLVAVGAMYTTFHNTSERVLDAQMDDLSDSMEQGETAIIIETARWNGSHLILEVRNTGGTVLDVNRTELLLDGAFTTPHDAASLTISGTGGTEVWAPDQVLRLVYTENAYRVRVVTEHGITAFTRRTNTTRDPIVFTDIGSSDMETLKRDEMPTARYDVEDTQAAGPKQFNFDDDVELEIPYIDSAGSVRVVDINGEDRQLTTNAQHIRTTIAIGRWQDSRRSIFFVNDSTNELWRVTGRGVASAVDHDGTVDADGVAGIVDFDGDGRDELVYGGNATADNSVNYVDDNGSLVETGATYSVNTVDSRIGLGDPANFNGTGGARTPIVRNGDLLLVGPDGSETSLGVTDAQTGPLASLDWDSDEEQELLFVEQSTGYLQYVDNVTSGNDVYTITNREGTVLDIDADVLAG